jgi:hypothetical protein
MNIKYTIFLYLILILFIFIFRPKLLILNNDFNKRKLLYLIFLIIILAIISFYIKVLTEWFF